MRGSFLPFKFIGDAAYSMRPWIYSFLKGERHGLPRRKNSLEFYPIKHSNGCEKDIRYSERKIENFTQDNGYVTSDYTGYCHCSSLITQFIYNSE